ncbi:MAG: Holliday junction branch migration protein RuvA [candidate division Zixibacteria bacterium]|nr:Holliday junction branch migration protein RuvA [candidate division Zixibacteria bacterium]
MIAYLEGKLVEKSPTQLILDVNGVGYCVNIPISTYDRLGELGSKVKIITYQHVREDCLQLFGFYTPEEKWLFELLISVNGIGPKTGLGILSFISLEDFHRAIMEEHIDFLTNVPGIGRKTAQRLVVELKEKFGKLDLKKELSVDAKSHTDAMIEQEAILALCSLGYSRYEAKKAIDKGKEGTKEKLTVEELIKRALRKVNSKR